MSDQYFSFIYRKLWKYSLFHLYFSPITEAVYDDTLKSVKESFPQYIRELEGVSHGAGVEFHKVSVISL